MRLAWLAAIIIAIGSLQAEESGAQKPVVTFRLLTSNAEISLTPKSAKAFLEIVSALPTTTESNRRPMPLGFFKSGDKVYAWSASTFELEGAGPPRKIWNHTKIKRMLERYATFNYAQDSIDKVLLALEEAE